MATFNRYYLKHANGWFQEIASDFVTTVNGETVQVPYGNLLVWNTDADFLEYNCYRVVCQKPEADEFISAVTVTTSNTGAPVVQQVISPIVPASVTRRQIKLVLDSMGLLDDIEAMVASANSSVKIEWAEANEFDRNHPVILAFATAMNKTSDDLDQVFIAAGKL